MYDWGRLGADGRPRPLHVDRALEVINFDQTEPVVQPARPVEEQAGCRRAMLCRSDYFVTERVDLAAGAELHGRCAGDSLEIWGAISGQAEIDGVALPAVRFCLLPAALGDYRLRAVADTTLLRTYVDQAK